MNTDLELYRVFYEVAKHKNITKTAESMYISQSAITQSIHKFENLLGGKVFYRSKNGVELTEEGKNLYEYIKDSIETMNNAENVFSKYNSIAKSKIRIGGEKTLITSLILEPLMQYIKKYPDVEISISEDETDTLMQKLLNGELDIVILNLPNKYYSNIEIKSLKKSKYCFFASKQYTKENSIKSMDEIDKYTLILPKTNSKENSILEKYCNTENILLSAKYHVSNSDIMKKMVLNNIGIGFANIEELKDIQDNIKILKRIELSDYKEGIATLKKSMCNKATIELVKEIEQYYN